MAVGDDERRAVVSFGFEEGLQRVLVLCAHRDAGDIHVAVGHRDEAKVLLHRRLAASRKLRDRSAWRGFRALSAGVGINLSVEHKDLHVAPAGQHGVKPTEADVVSPAVAADDPDALTDQRIGHGKEAASVFGVDALQLRFQLGHSLVLLEDVSFVALLLFQDSPGQLFSHLRGERLERLGGELALLVQ